MLKPDLLQQTAPGRRRVCGFSGTRIQDFLHVRQMCKQAWSQLYCGTTKCCFKWKFSLCRIAFFFTVFVFTCLIFKSVCDKHGEKKENGKRANTFTPQKFPVFSSCAQVFWDHLQVSKNWLEFSIGDLYKRLYKTQRDMCHMHLTPQPLHIQWVNVCVALFDDNISWNHAMYLPSGSKVHIVRLFLSVLFAVAVDLEPQYHVHHCERWYTRTAF